MVKRKVVKRPTKKNDKELFDQIGKKLETGEYVFKKHARQRQKDRVISDLEVLNVLENINGYKRRRNKSKDKYEENRQDWNYCIEGATSDNDKMRIIISFEDGILPIITVMWID